MRNKLVFDLPTRLFHWTFSILFLLAFAIAKLVDDESVVFSYHMLIGLSVSSVVLLRLGWGFLGTKHARFSGFSLRPRELFDYMKGTVTGSLRTWPGHNPATSWAALSMMALALGLGATGFLMTATSDKERYEDFHEIFGDALIVLVILHIAGLILHSFRHRDMIALSMVDGKKADVPNEETLRSARTKTGIAFLALVLATGLHLWKHFDSQTRRLDFFGISLQLGKSGASNE